MKRSMDVTLATVGLLFASPVLAAIIPIIWLLDRHSPFYVAARVGRDGKPFNMIKLRSMIVNADETGVNSTAADDPRITTIGQFIRATKLDELTQLWNVLRGDMSLVGPRPNTWKWGVELYTEEEKRLLLVRPGVTDLSSIVFADEGAILRGADEPDIVYNQLIRPWKSRLGLFCIDHTSLRLDLELIWLTALAMFSRRWALAGVGRVRDRLSAPDDPRRVARREERLVAIPPPGAERVVDSRPTKPVFT